VVNGNLFLGNTPIKALPKRLVVNGNLNLSGTKISEIPNDLRVGGYLYVYNTPNLDKTKIPDTGAKKIIYK
jgi:hypothetical protein